MALKAVVREAGNFVERNRRVQSDVVMHPAAASQPALLLASSAFASSPPSYAGISCAPASGRPPGRGIVEATRRLRRRRT